MTGIDVTSRATMLDAIVRDVQLRLHEDEAFAERHAGGPSRMATLTLRGSIEQEARAGHLAVIAEVKRRSPSAGVLADAGDIVPRVRAYDAAGAVGMSILTERDHFGGSLDDLAHARSCTSLPLLRKDFIIDEVQLRAARAAGADAVLLIAAIHEPARLGELVDAAHRLQLEVLMEVHDAADIERIDGIAVDLVGINSRNLRTFDVDLGVVDQLAPTLRSGVPVVAESGIATAADAARVRDAGARAVLVGSALMRQPDPGALLGAFRQLPQEAAP